MGRALQYAIRLQHHSASGSTRRRPLMAVAIVLVWTVSLSCLLWQIASLVTSSAPRLAPIVSLAALTVAASISAFYTPQSFHWLIASTVQYTLPAAILTAILALMLASVKRARGGAGRAVSGLAVALACFVCAGFAEMFLVFQLAFLSLLLMAAVVNFTMAGAAARRIIGIGQRLARHGG